MVNMILLTMKKILLYMFFVIVIFLFVQKEFNIFDISFNSEKKTEDVKTKNEEQENTIEFFNEDGKVLIVQVDIAENENERAQGLSGRAILGDYEGMLFIMPQQQYHKFWMKDMLIPLDMVFIDEEGFIVDIKENVQPCENNGICTSFTAHSPFKYVVELNSGFIESNRVKMDTNVIFNISSNL